ncbi:hypothetical protein Dimus_017500 [Dionaea muscipula]
MKSGKSQKEKVIAARVKQNVGKISTSVKKSASGSSSRPHKGSGKDTTSLGLVQCIRCKAQCSEMNEVPSLFQLDQVETHNPPSKIKLQLFPLDEAVRRGLEKDGHNPYLELILRPQKQICSVLNHLRNKWGGSSVAVGEPVLFPCNDSVENFAGPISWTLNHKGVTAGDVHAAVGSPKHFRLRYGWFMNHQSTYVLAPSSSGSFLGCIEPKLLEKVHSPVHETMINSTNNTEVTVMQLQSSNTSEPANPVEQVSSAEVLINEEPRIHNGLQQIPSLCSDDLSNISIGGLLAEASLQGLFNPSDAISNRGIPEFQLNLLMPNSKDNYISNSLKCPQDQKNVSPDLSCSILDAEETCHSFAFQKFASSAKDRLQTDGSIFPTEASHDIGTKLYDIPETTEAKTETETASRMGIFNDERSLGLSGIRWGDSLGPFDDLGPSFQRSISQGRH